MKAHHLKDNAWFVAYAPKNDPQIVVACLYEDGVHGNFAAELVRDVMKAYFDKQLRVKQREQALRHTNDLFSSLRPVTFEP